MIVDVVALDVSYLDTRPARLVIRAVLAKLGGGGHNLPAAE